MKKIILILFIILFLPLNVLAKAGQTVNIAFTIDNNYPIFTLLAINSMLINNKQNADIHFYIVENNLTNANKNKMRKYIEKRGQKVDFINFDTKVIDNGINYFTFSNRITPIAMARIMLPEILPKDIDRVIYLDGDILVTGDIKELFGVNLKGRPLGMAGNNYMAKHYLPCPKNCKKKHFYGNSGVIVMDLDKFRKENITKKILDYFNTNKIHFAFKELENKFFYMEEYFLYPDQDLINVVLDGRIFPLEQRWNNQIINNTSLVTANNLGILHYIGSVKPWNFPENLDVWNKLYIDYWDNSGLVIYKYYYAMKEFNRRFQRIYKIKFLRILANIRRHTIFLYRDVYINLPKQR